MSQYKGVFWNKKYEKWFVVLYLKGQKQKYGGVFKDELDAAKKVNQLCEEFGIPPKNPGITGTQNQQLQVTKIFFYSHEIVRKICEILPSPPSPQKTFCSTHRITAL